MSKYFLY